MKIPFGKPFIDKSEKTIIKVLSQPILAHGKQTKEFEKNLEILLKRNTHYQLHLVRLVCICFTWLLV